jgi:hypothetical protein
MPLTNLLDKTATVHRAGAASPATGTPPPCAIAPADWRTVAEYAQQGISAAFLIYSAVDLGAAAGDQVTVDGKTYPVLAVRSFSNSAFGAAVYVTVCGSPA